MTKDEKNTAIYVAFEEELPYDPSTPEKNLLRAVLLSAMSDLGKPGEAGRKALSYFLNRDENYVFSFTSICDYLLIDPKRILTVTGLRNGHSGKLNGNSHAMGPSGKIRQSDSADELDDA
jgi:hypothetical protein